MRDVPKKMKPRRIQESRFSSRALIAASAILAIGLIIGLSITVGAGGGTRGKSPALQSQQEGAVQGATTGVRVSALEQVMVPPLSIYRRRNPFKPLVVMEIPEGQQQQQQTGTGGAGGYVSVPPQLSSQSNESGEVLSRMITLESVYEENRRLYARIRVADQVYDRVGVGDRFGEHFKLLSLGTDSTATVLYGDERMTLYEGQTINW